ncbi:MAG: ribosomal protein L10 [Candidatus Nanosalina sp. J07AB43]|jgi:Ribosomal protein L10|nr:MAG: ribosomal protein L10 [Candidatus Nanosalina sp. J07AB43]
MVQPKPKNLTREQKEAKVEEFEQAIQEHKVIGILDMQSLPARQLQEIEREIEEFADIKMSRKTLMNIALDNIEREGLEELDTDEAMQPAFIFSTKDPFQLYSLIQDNQTSAAADGGEIAPNDIEVPEGDTGIGPGPMLGKLQQTGAQVQVDDGSIHVMQPATMVEAGDEITSDDAEILNQLGIEPLQIGLDLVIAYNDGEVFNAEELDIDTDQYREDIESAAASGFNLAVNAEVINETTASAIVSEAAQKAKNVAISEGLPEEETIKESVSYAHSAAQSVDSEVNLESIQEEEDESEESEEESSEDSEEEKEEAETEDGN